MALGPKALLGMINRAESLVTSLGYHAPNDYRNIKAASNIYGGTGVTVTEITAEGIARNIVAELVQFPQMGLLGYISSRTSGKFDIFSGEIFADETEFPRRVENFFQSQSTDGTKDLNRESTSEDDLDQGEYSIWRFGTESWLRDLAAEALKSPDDMSIDFGQDGNNHFCLSGFPNEVSARTFQRELLTLLQGYYFIARFPWMQKWNIFCQEEVPALG